MPLEPVPPDNPLESGQHLRMKIEVNLLIHTPVSPGRYFLILAAHDEEPSDRASRRRRPTGLRHNFREPKQVTRQ